MVLQVVEVQGFDNGNRPARFVFDFDIQFSQLEPGCGTAGQGLIFDTEAAGSQQKGHNRIATVFIRLQGFLNALDLR